MTKKTELTEQEVYSVLNFANALYGNNVFTPQLLNQNLIDLNNQPLKPTYDKLIRAISSSKYSAEELQGYSEYLEWSDSIYNKIINYYSGLLSFDLSYSCKNARGEDYKSEQYKEDLDKVYKFLNGFDYQGEFKKILKLMIRNETVFTWLRDNRNNINPKYALQILPQDMCMLTGYFEQGLIFDISMSYFLRPGVDINAYPEIFEDYYNDTFKGMNTADYIPTNPFGKRDGTFSFYHQTDPLDGAFAWKFDTSNFNSVPFLSSKMVTNLLNGEMQALQKDKNIQGAFAFLIGEMQMLDNAQSKQADAFAINPATLGSLLQMLKAGLNSSRIRIGAMPTEEVEWYQYQDYNKDMYDKQLKQSAGQSASASRMIYADDKMSQSELENAIITDYNTVKKVYSQFNSFLDLYVNRKTKKYKFNFNFDGCSYPFERKQRFTQLMELGAVGIVLNSSAYASALGVKPNMFDAMMDEAHNGDFLTKLSPLISIHTSTDKSKGQPEKDSSELSDGGSVARDYT